MPVTQRQKTWIGENDKRLKNKECRKMTKDTKTKPESNWRHARKHFPWTEGDQIMQQFVLCDNFIMTNNCHPTNTKIALETNTIIA